MQIEEVISQQRELYVNDLKDFYKQRTKGARELLLELNLNKSIRPFNLYRIDYCEKINGEPKLTELNSEKYFDFNPIEFHYQNLEIELNPFFWNGCNFLMGPYTSDFGWLIDWTNKWIDEAGAMLEDSNGLSGVIHGVTTPEKQNESLIFSVDFGSAETNAFWQLIETIQLQGARSLKISSSLIERA